ncbi:hypothetical protein ACFQ0B_50945 [Nonomuraea thailandensis]
MIVRPSSFVSPLAHQISVMFFFVPVNPQVEVLCHMTALVPFLVSCRSASTPAAPQALYWRMAVGLLGWRIWSRSQALAPVG